MRNQKSVYHRGEKDIAEPFDPLLDRRLISLANRGKRDGFDAVMVYATKADAKNLLYLTAYAPKQGDALLIVRPLSVPTLVVCPADRSSAFCKVKTSMFFESCEYLAAASPGSEARADIADTIVAHLLSFDRKVGTIACRTRETNVPVFPTWIVDALRKIRCSVRNATYLLR